MVPSQSFVAGPKKGYGMVKFHFAVMELLIQPLATPRCFDS
jgi:hypothetical protein